MFATASLFDIDGLENIGAQPSSVDQLFDELFASDASVSFPWYAGESSSSSQLFPEDLYQPITAPIEDPYPYSPIARSSTLPEDFPHQPQPFATTSEHHVSVPSSSSIDDVPQACITPSDIMPPLPTPPQQFSPAATRPQPTPPPIAATPDPVFDTTAHVLDNHSDAGSLFSGSASVSGDDDNHNEESHGGAAEAAPADCQWDSDQDAEGEPDELEYSGDEKCEVPVEDTLEAPLPVDGPTRIATPDADEVKPEENDNLSEADADCETDPDADPQDEPWPTITSVQDQKKRKRASEDDDGDHDWVPPPAQRLRLGYKSLPRPQLQLKRRRAVKDDEAYVPSRAGSVHGLDGEREGVWLEPGPSTSIEGQQARKRKRPTDEEDEEEEEAEKEEDEDEYTDDSSDAEHSSSHHRPRKMQKLSPTTTTTSTTSPSHKPRFQCNFAVQRRDGTSRLCGATFSRPSDVKRHQESRHERSAWTCEMCGAVLSRKDALRRHWRNRHPDAGEDLEDGEGGRPDDLEDTLGARRRRMPRNAARPTQGSRRSKGRREGYMAPVYTSDEEDGSIPESED